MSDTISLYNEIRELYPLVKDTDGLQAYELMQKANVLRSMIDEYAVQQDKIATFAKNNVDIVKSQLSIKYDIKNSTNGNRRAIADEEYKKVVADYAEVKATADLYERQIEFLKNVSFQMFSVWDNCKKVRERY